MNKKTVFLVYVIAALAVSTAYAGWFSTSGGDSVLTRTTVTSGSGIYQIYPAACTRVVLTAGRTNKVAMMIPRPVTYTTAAPIVKGVTKNFPLSSTVLRNYFGNLRMELNAAPGAGNSVRAALRAKCLAQTNNALTIANLTIGGGTKTFNQSSDWTCQDQAFPTPVTLAITTSASLTSATAFVCFDTYKAIDPCPTGTVSTETTALCTKD